MKRNSLNARPRAGWRLHHLSMLVLCALAAEPSLVHAQSPGMMFNPNNLWMPQAEIYGSVGNENDAGRAKLVLPIYQNYNSMWFTDLRASTTEDLTSLYDVGIAYRHLNRCCPMIWGVYAFYDWAQSEDNHHNFSQVMAGAEMMSTRWDARINLYAPLKNTADDNDHPIPEVEKALYGADAEAGYNFGYGLPSVFLGGYYFDASNVDVIAGPRAHADLKLGDFVRRINHCDANNIFDHVEVTAEVQHDNPRGTQAWFEARFKFDLQRNRNGRLEGMESRMMDRIIRGDIVTEEARGENGEAVNQGIGGGGGCEGREHDEKDQGGEGINDHGEHHDHDNDCHDEKDEKGGNGDENGQGQGNGNNGVNNDGPTHTDQGNGKDHGHGNVNSDVIPVDPPVTPSSNSNGNGNGASQNGIDHASSNSTIANTVSANVDAGGNNGQSNGNGASQNGIDHANSNSSVANSVSTNADAGKGKDK